MEISTIIIGFVSIVIGLGIFILGWISANKISHAKMHNAETYARKITQDAEREALSLEPPLQDQDLPLQPVSEPARTKQCLSDSLPHQSDVPLPH